MDSPQQVEPLIEAWIKKHGNFQGSIEVSPNLDLIDAGVLDSMKLLLLSVYVEELRGTPIEPSTLTLESFSSVKKIMETFF